VNRAKLAIIALVGVAVLGATIPAGVLAAKPKAPPAAVVFGNLVSFDQNGAVVGTPNGNVNINFTANTDYYPNNQAAAVAGFKAGDQVLARGYFRNGFWTATIRYDLVPFAISGVVKFEGRLVATPAASPPFTLTIMIRKNVNKTFLTNDSTRYYDDGKLDKDPLHDLHVNVPLTIYGQEYSDSSWLARVVVIHDNEPNNG
jgi:Domain of unknown function (DUF5666)